MKKIEMHHINQRLRRFKQPDNKLASLNLILAIVFYCASVSLLFVALSYDGSYLIGCLLLIGLYLTSGLAIVKLFTIQHDCGHGSFFSCQNWNENLGRVCSVITFIPFEAWRKEHNEHHANFGRVDVQTFGDVRLMSVEQFRRAAWWQRLVYRVFRNPVFLLGVAPLGYLLLRQRVPSRFTLSRIVSCLAHTAALGLLYGLLMYWLGVVALLVFFPALYVAGVVAVAIFVVEHQFESAEWAGGDGWSLGGAAIGASSYLSMPTVLEWITGNVGYHHIHHISPRIPSYNLKVAFLSLGCELPHKEISLTSIPRQLQLALWSERHSRLMTFREASKVYASTS